MPPAKFFTPATLLGTAVFSFVAVALLSPLVETQHEFFALELKMASSTAGRMQLFRDSGAGFSEADSSLASLVQSETPLRYRLPIPAGSYQRLRFDPIEGEGVFQLAAPPRIVGKNGRVVRKIKSSEIAAAHQIQLRPAGAGALELTTEPGASDPQLLIAFSSPLELRARWAEVIARLLPASLAFFAVLAALLHSLDRRLRVRGETRWRHALRPPLWFLLMLVAAVACARRPDAVSTPQFWGEDSIIFYRDAYMLGPIALLKPYAGYLLAVPRLVAAASIWIDPLWAPAFFSIIALALTLYVAARTQSSRSPLPRHAGFALAIVLVPDAFEVLLNLDNVQWIMAAGFLLLLISADGQSRSQLVHDGVAALVFGFTGPFSILFAPLFLWRAWRRRNRSSLVLAMIVVIAAATQAWTIWRNPVAQVVNKIVPEAALAAPGIRIGGSLLLGALAPRDFTSSAAIALSLLTLVGVAALAVRKGAMQRERIWLALALFILLGVTLYRLRYELPVACQVGMNSRYFFTLQLIVIWLVLAAASDKRRWVSRTATALVLWSLLINLPRLREWAFQDLQWPYYAAKIRAGEAVEVPVNPKPWVMSLPAKPRS